MSRFSNKYLLGIAINNQKESHVCLGLIMNNQKNPLVLPSFPSKGKKKSLKKQQNIILFINNYTHCVSNLANFLVLGLFVVMDYRILWSKNTLLIVLSYFLLRQTSLKCWGKPKPAYEKSSSKGRATCISPSHTQC